MFKRLRKAYANWQFNRRDPHPYVLAFVEGFKLRPEDFRPDGSETLHDHSARHTLQYCYYHVGNITRQHPNGVITEAGWYLRPYRVNSRNGFRCNAREIALLGATIDQVGGFVDTDSPDGKTAKQLDTWTSQVTDTNTRYQEEVGAN